METKEDKEFLRNEIGVEFTDEIIRLNNNIEVIRKIVEYKFGKTIEVLIEEVNNETKRVTTKGKFKED